MGGARNPAKRGLCREIVQGVATSSGVDSPGPTATTAKIPWQANVRGLTGQLIKRYCACLSNA